MMVSRNEKNRPYVIFQKYKPQKNLLANVAFYVSAEDCSVEDPVCADDVPGQLFVQQLKGSDFDVQLGLQDTLKRRGFEKLDSLVKSFGTEGGVDTRKADRKCIPPCWFCKYKCVICLQPASITTNVNGEDILHCSDQCLQVVYENPGVISILPTGHEISHTPDRKESLLVTLPSGHSVVCHITRDYLRKNGENGQFTIFLCADNTGDDETWLYVLYHQFNLLRLITFGFYVCGTTLKPLKQLPCSSKQQELKCLNYMQQLFSTEPIDDILKAAIERHGISQLRKDTIDIVKDTKCTPPCWYCR